MCPDNSIDCEQVVVLSRSERSLAKTNHETSRQALKCESENSATRQPLEGRFRSCWQCIIDDGEKSRFSVADRTLRFDGKSVAHSSRSSALRRVSPGVF